MQQVANCLGFLTIQMSEYKDKTNAERIPFLYALGFDRNRIASILATTPNTVSVRLSEVGATRRQKATEREVDSNAQDQSGAAG